MKLQFKTLILLLLIPALVMANDKFGGKYTKEKTLKKEYSVNADALLKVDNSYGNIDVVAWNENRVEIVVHIKTNGNNEEKVQKRLDEITVDFSGSSSLVSAKTVFNKKSSWKFWNHGANGVHMEINYTIKLPVTNSVDLDNDYGAIGIDKLQGVCTLSCDYGQLNIGELMADNNSLNFDYTNKSTIGYMKSGKIDADYSGFTLEKAESLELDAGYSQSEILECEELNYNCDYGKVVVGNATNIEGEADYVTQRLGTVRGSVDLNSDYGSIKIGRLTETAKDVTINGDYTGIKIGFANDYSFNFALDLSYAGFNGEENLTVTKSHKENSQKKISGHHGNQNSGNQISITSDYGGVTFYKN